MIKHYHFFYGSDLNKKNAVFQRYNVKTDTALSLSNTKNDNLSFRGFGFITFADVSGVDKVLEHGLHDLDGKKVSFEPLAKLLHFL